jgi:hypothetical protein
VSVEVLCDQVRADGVAEQIEKLALGTDAAGALEVAVVVDAAIDGLGVLAPSIDVLVARVSGWDLADVLGPVEARGAVVIVGVGGQSEGLREPAARVGHSVEDLEAVRAVSVRASLGLEPFEGLEDNLGIACDDALTSAAGLVPDVDGLSGSIGVLEGHLLEWSVLFDASSAVRLDLGGGDRSDHQQSCIALEFVGMGASQHGVGEYAMHSVRQGEGLEFSDCDVGLAVGFVLDTRDMGDVEDDAFVGAVTPPGAVPELGAVDLGAVADDVGSWRRGRCARGAPRR